MEGKLLVLIAAVLVIPASLIAAVIMQDGSGGGGPLTFNEEDFMVGETEMMSFSSMEELETFVQTNQDLRYDRDRYGYLDRGGYYRNKEATSDPLGLVDADSNDSDGVSESAGGSSDHSTTNVQEKGVDEGDVVKNDGEYAYIVSNDKRSVHIIDVYPAGDPRIVSTIEANSSVREIYVKEDRLLVVEDLGGWTYPMDGGGYYSGFTDLYIFDITKRSSPELIREDRINGRFVTSRMLGDDIYLIGRDSIDGVRKEQLPLDPSDIHYIDGYDEGYQFTSVACIDSSSKTLPVNQKAMLLGRSTEVYVSNNNIYLSQQRRMSWLEQKERELDEVIEPILPARVSSEIDRIQERETDISERMTKINDELARHIDTLTDTEREELYDEWEEDSWDFQERIAPELERTAIHRIYIGNGDITFTASGEVPGYILNRFSMGEYNGHFRIATTTGHVSRSGIGDAKNHLFVLDMALDVVGSVNDIAPGERIYSARFMGERAYLVTFDKVDPFFVIDVSVPASPTILGELKIPGYSDYLHPYDANHVIGLGKETVLAEGGQFSWYQGVKLSLFDVTDVENPVELSKYIIGDRGTYSIAQDDPHAFLFGLSKNLLVLPISLCEIDESKYGGNIQPNTHGEFVWSGAYVFRVTTSKGFELMGRITHSESEEVMEWYYYDNSGIYRSFYIDDVVYTVSRTHIVENDMITLRKLGSLELPGSDVLHERYYLD